MLSNTLRTTNEAGLPIAVRPAFDHSPGQGVGSALLDGRYRGLAMLPVGFGFRASEAPGALFP